MKINIPGNIDLTHPEKYILIFGLREEQPYIYLHGLNTDYPIYYFPVYNEGNNLFLTFKELLFENEFLTLSFHKIIVINYSPVFTFVPTILYKETDKKSYIDFLYHNEQERILSHYLERPELVILHSMKEEFYEFLCRSFLNMEIIHYLAPCLSYFSKDQGTSSVKRMIIYERLEGMDIFCFQGSQLLLANFFPLSSVSDAFYYPLFIWKQLKYNQLIDHLYLIGENEKLFEELGKYIQNLSFGEISESRYYPEQKEIPFELYALKEYSWKISGN